MTKEEYNKALHLRVIRQDDYTKFEKILDELSSNRSVSVIAAITETVIKADINKLCSPGGDSGAHLAAIVLQKLAAEYVCKSLDIEIEKYEASVTSQSTDNVSNN